VPTGITYYSTQNQVPRPTPLKRPKAAIPIVPPPANEGKQEDQHDGSGLDDSEKVGESIKEVEISSTDMVHKVEDVKPEVHPTEISA
jgi:hypothetical protein